VAAKLLSTLKTCRRLPMLREHTAIRTKSTVSTALEMSFVMDQEWDDLGVVLSKCFFHSA
jgi:hypothetical protein